MSLNRTITPQPFHLHFTSFNDQKMKNMMGKINPKILTGETPEEFKEESYLDVFPKERLVYLSPDSK